MLAMMLCLLCSFIDAPHNNLPASLLPQLMLSLDRQGSLSGIGCLQKQLEPEYSPYSLGYVCMPLLLLAICSLRCLHTWGSGRMIRPDVHQVHADHTEQACCHLLPFKS